VINDLDESGLAERRGASNPDKEQIRTEQEEETQGKEDELSDQEVASSRKSSIKLDEDRDEIDENPNERQRKQSIVKGLQQQDEDEQE
jgi:exosome complex RNA-binding protein Csl4